MATNQPLTIIVNLTPGDNPAQLMLRLHVTGVLWDPEWKEANQHVEVDYRTGQGGTWMPLNKRDFEVIDNG